MSAALGSILDRLGSRSLLVTAVDVVVVYYLIYRLLLMIRGTRAAQMVVGIVLIGAAFYACERLELTTVSWLLDTVINYFIIIVIVVFQEDIRRALGRLGQGVLPFSRAAAEAGELLDEVVAATMQLARARMGASIVLERELWHKAPFARAALLRIEDSAARSARAVSPRHDTSSLGAPVRPITIADSIVSSTRCSISSFKVPTSPPPI